MAVVNLRFISKLKANINNLKKDKSGKKLSPKEIERLTIEEVKYARSNFKDADEDTMDLAIYELMAAEERLNLLIRDRKKKQ